MNDRLVVLTEALVERARERFHGADAKVVDGLLKHYYSGVSPDDLDERLVDDLYGAALCHWQLARRRAPGVANIRVYTPAVGEDGWQTPHTVVDIVTDDMPFLFDSVLMAIEADERAVHLVAHPVLDVIRDDDGLLTSLAGAGTGDGPSAIESFIHVEVDRIGSDHELERLAARLGSVLDDTAAAVSDWAAMREQARLVERRLDSPVTGVADDDRAEARALLRFLVDDHFTFIGYRRYEFDGDDIVSVEGTGLGVLAASPPSRTPLGELTPEGAALARSPIMPSVTKANVVSTVHRAGRLDYVGIKYTDADGAVVGEHRFLGLFTASVYTAPVQELPVVRRKVAAILAECGDQASSHDRAALLSILEAYPRDELFDAAAADLARIVEGILHLRDRRRVKLFVRRDIFGRYSSCLVFVPRDRYNTEVRLQIQDLLLRQFGGGRCLFDSQVSGAVLARVHILVFTDPHDVRDVDVEAVERAIDDLTRGWVEELHAALVDRHGEAVGLDRFERYGRAFPNAYRDDHRPAVAVDDIERLELVEPGGLSVNLYRPLEADERTLRLKLFRSGEPVTLSAILPLLHDLGVTVTDERPYELRRDTTGSTHIYDFGLHLPLGADGTTRVREAFEDAFMASWKGMVESDGFHHLVLTAGLGWQEVTVLRAYRRYLRQIGSAFSQSYYEQALCDHPRIARLLLDAFHVRFDPGFADDRERAWAAVQQQLEQELDAVPNLDEDRILRSLFSLIGATTRTNHYQREPDGGPRRELALKLDPSTLDDLPLPRPAHEIFVYSPRVEGVHLRAGRVARGGIRWSDRREDFRTEVLGLMKAQTVKNAVIVPLGAKGGFVAKRLTAFTPPAEARAEVLDSYRRFIGALLDVTDNLVDGTVVPPERVVRYDGDDPYLVVAADKGTATFSDVANEIAVSRGFWLRDAFASGGSAGYDHKAMGITARGAWRSVQRHFRELGVDVQSQPFTAVGIGDMSGDVFGNGMLLSPTLRLVAAFDHRHIFIDPDPDPTVALAERRRLFALTRSSWADYDPTLISAGGAVFERTAKSITIAPEIRAALGIADEVAALTPAQLIRHVLMAPVDLLWNGGVGTFVKASGETNADAGDRANDASRVDAADLRCRVVGEGGNLGLTELARVEFAGRGGKVYSDAIDNSAGVNCSDHEVNIKILLDTAVDEGDLTMKQRDQLLTEMTDEVAELVLAENYHQTGAISAARMQAAGMVEVHQRHLQWLERVAGVNRALEALPSDEELNERRDSGAGLTAPELAVMLAYTKIALADGLLVSGLPDDPECRHYLSEYFPRPVRERFADRLDRHPLARELIVTVVTNRLVDRAGLSMAYRLGEETSVDFADIARAHLAAWTIFELEAAWQAVDALDNTVAAEVQLDMVLEIKRLGERATRWLLRNQALPLDISTVVERYAPGVARLRELIGDVLGEPDDRAAQRTLELVNDRNVPAPLAAEVAHMGLAITALDILEVHRSTSAPLEDAAAVYFELDGALRLAWFRQRIIALPRDDRWASLARSALRDDFFAAHAALAASVIASRPEGGDAGEWVTEWMARQSANVEQCLAVLTDIRASGRADLAQLSVGLRELRNLVHLAGRDLP
ncbi:MAG: NAD-glutamate dehydrogenase [Acidimicrobiales bacterium]